MSSASVGRRHEDHDERVAQALRVDPLPLGTLEELAEVFGESPTEPHLVEAYRDRLRAERRVEVPEGWGWFQRREEALVRGSEGP